MPDNDVTATPLRALPSTDDQGVQVVRDAGSSWLDGSEVLLLERMQGDLPLDSLSDELYATATDWPQRYHLSPSRANVVRALDLPADAAVLEIGAGCGAITRYLGEVCATVDALEPTLARARVAAARTAELPGVTVFCAEVSDLPGVPAYDVVVVVGVLEYVGSGGRDARPYVEFLENLRRNLKPGGQLVLAIENQLGVKYLAGAPEDHSGEVFHSVEGYPVDGPARTFSRRRLVELAELAGFTVPRVLGAFPDYKLTRMVFDEELLERARSLAVRVPRFPSPDWVIDRPALADEAHLWAELVDAGTAMDFANSFVLLAGNGDPDRDAWPAGRLASYFSMSRRRSLQVRKHVVAQGDGVVVSSGLLGSGSADGLAVLPYTEPWAEGRTVEELATADPAALPGLVAQWVRVFRERVSAGGAPFDLLPHNLVFVGAEMRVIDDEWRGDTLSVEDVFVRGALLLARDLSDLRGHEYWGASSRRDLAVRIAAFAGVALDRAGVEAAIVREAELQAVVGGGARGTEIFAEVRARMIQDVTAQLDRDTGGEAPRRAWEELERSRQDAIQARDLLCATGEQLDQARTELDSLRAETADLQRAVASLQSPWRTIARRLRPGMDAKA